MGEGADMFRRMEDLSSNPREFDNYLGRIGIQGGKIVSKHVTAIPSMSRALGEDGRRTYIKIRARVPALRMKRYIRQLRSPIYGDALPDDDVLRTFDIVLVRDTYPKNTNENDTTLNTISIGSIMDHHNTYAHMRRGIHSTNRTRLFTVPMYASGYDPRFGMYSLVTERVDHREPSERDVKNAWTEMIRAGVYPMSKSSFTGGKGGETLVTDPLKLFAIPKSVYRQFLTKRKSMSERDAWVASGGSTWAQGRGLPHTFPKTNLLSFIKQSGPLTSNETINKYVEQTMMRKQLVPDESNPKLVDLVRVSDFQNKVALGKGAYGTVYGIVLNDDNRDLVHKLQSQLRNYMDFGPIPQKATSVVIKFESIQTKRLSQQSVNGLGAEAYIQNYVHTNSGMDQKERSKHRPVAPKIFFSGTLASNTQFKYHIICMEMAPGVPLHKFARPGRMTHEIYEGLKESIYTLLLNGVTHSDLHTNNVFVSGTGRSTRITILDYGFATIVPPPMKRSIVDVLKKTGSIDRAFYDTGLLNATNASKSQFPYYHSNRKTLQHIGSLLKKRDLVSHAISINSRMSTVFGRGSTTTKSPSSTLYATAMSRGKTSNSPTSVVDRQSRGGNPLPKSRGGVSKFLTASMLNKIKGLKTIRTPFKRPRSL
jgi:hypothetical protein